MPCRGHSGKGARTPAVINLLGGFRPLRLLSAPLPPCQSKAGAAQDHHWGRAGLRGCGQTRRSSWALHPALSHGPTEPGTEKPGDAREQGTEVPQKRRAGWAQSNERDGQGSGEGVGLGHSRRGQRRGQGPDGRKAQGEAKQLPWAGGSSHSPFTATAGVSGIGNREAGERESVL